jgi:hypothetical protein
MFEHKVFDNTIRAVKYLYIRSMAKFLSGFWQKTKIKLYHDCRFRLLFGIQCRTTQCCYITVDFATAESQIIFRSYKLYLHRKANIIESMTKTVLLILILPFIIEHML